MKLFDYLILLLLAVWLIVSIIGMTRRKGSCGGNCAGCTQNCAYSKRKKNDINS